MTEEDAEAERYFEALAGRATSSQAATHALREALLARAQTLRSSEGSKASDLTQEEVRRMQSALQGLSAAGAFAAPSSDKPKENLGALEYLRSRVRRFTTWSPARMVATAAILGLATALTLQVWLPEREEGTRGVTTPVLRSSEPQAKANDLAERLRRLGAEVTVTKLNAEEWMVHVELPNAGSDAAIKAILAEEKVLFAGAAPYEFLVRAR